MKRLSVLFILLWLPCCSGVKPAKADTPEQLFKILSEADGLNQALGCCTQETVKTAGEIMRQGYAGESEMLAALAFLRGAEDWDILPADYSPNEDAGVFDVVITRHRIDNLKGFRISCVLKKEEGQWRMDMADKLSASFGAAEGNVVPPEDYLEHKLKVILGQ